VLSKLTAIHLRWTLCNTAAALSVLPAAAVIRKIRRRALGHWSGWWYEAVYQLSASYLLLINPIDTDTSCQLRWRCGSLLLVEAQLLNTKMLKLENIWTYGMQNKSRRMVRVKLWLVLELRVRVTLVSCRFHIYNIPSHVYWLTDFGWVES